MPQVVKSGGSGSSSSQNVGISRTDTKNFKTYAAIALCTLAVLVLLYFSYTAFAGPHIAAGVKVAPPAGYPDEFPYNLKMWQEGKMMGGGFPPPPKLGGHPPIPNPGVGH